MGLVKSTKSLNTSRQTVVTPPLSLSLCYCMLSIRQLCLLSCSTRQQMLTQDRAADLALLCQSANVVGN